MEQRIIELSVGELARRAKVSVRTLHHYDAIGLLKPMHVGANGYRTYGRAEMLRLQEILFYRQVGMGLSEIAAVLAGDGMLARLVRHRQTLAARAAQATAMLAALDRTIAELEGQVTMTGEDLYKPFPPAKQAEYEAWLIETYGKDMPRQIAESRDKVAGMTDWMRQDWTDRLKAVEARLVALHEAGADPASDEAHTVVADHRALVSEMTANPFDARAYAGLAELYATHPDFIARYELLSRGFSQWLPAAMRAHASRSGLG